MGTLARLYEISSRMGRAAHGTWSEQLVKPLFVTTDRLRLGRFRRLWRSCAHLSRSVVERASRWRSGAGPAEDGTGALHNEKGNSVNGAL